MSSLLRLEQYIYIFYIFIYLLLLLLVYLLICLFACRLKFFLHIPYLLAFQIQSRHSSRAQLKFFLS